MVKKLLSGLLKKKDNKEETKENRASSEESNEDVPDELPSLAEDLVEDTEEKTKEEEASSAEKSENSAPDELPSLDESSEEKKEEQPKEEEKKEDASKEEKPKQETPQETKEDISKEQKPQEEEKKEEVNEEQNKIQEAPKQEEQTNQAALETTKSEEEKRAGFFANILEHINKHQGSKEKLLSGDLFSRMSNYYELKKEEIKSGKSLPSQLKIEEEVKKKLNELQMLEQRWQMQKLALEEDLKFLHDREREIQLKVDELRRLSNELNLFNNVKPENYFYLNNGVVLKNLHDMIDVLEIIDNDTFSHHVNEQRNDFSDWIKNVIKDKNLATKVKKGKTKAEMIEILETEPVISEAIQKTYNRHISPRKYFWLENGVLIKNLFELCDALKTMEDNLFELHVNKEKNDFASWIKDELKMEELGKKLEQAKTREDMINVLEVYL